MEQEKVKNNKTWIVLIVVVAIAAGAYFVYKPVGGGKYKISFPFTQSVVSNTTFACEALIDS